jgi:hypothetical protein
LPKLPLLFTEEALFPEPACNSDRNSGGPDYQLPHCRTVPEGASDIIIRSSGTDRQAGDGCSGPNRFLRFSSLFLLSSFPKAQGGSSKKEKQKKPYPFLCGPEAMIMPPLLPGNFGNPLTGKATLQFFQPA